jgi:hypothetical protein
VVSTVTFPCQANEIRSDLEYFPLPPSKQQTVTTSKNGCIRICMEQDHLHPRQVRYITPNTHSNPYIKPFYTPLPCMHACIMYARTYEPPTEPLNKYPKTTLPRNPLLNNPQRNTSVTSSTRPGQERTAECSTKKPRKKPINTILNNPHPSPATLQKRRPVLSMLCSTLPASI